MIKNKSLLKLGARWAASQLENAVAWVIMIFAILSVTMLGGCTAPRGYSNGQSVSDLDCVTSNGTFEVEGATVVWTVLPVGLVMSGVGDDIDVSDPRALVTVLKGPFRKAVIIRMDTFLGDLPDGGLAPRTPDEALEVCPTAAKGLVLYACNTDEIILPAPNDGEVYSLLAELDTDGRFINWAAHMTVHFTFKKGKLVRQRSRQVMSRDETESDSRTTDDESEEREETTDDEQTEASEPPARPTRDRNDRRGARADADRDPARRQFGNGRRGEQHDEETDEEEHSPDGETTPPAPAGPDDGGHSSLNPEIEPATMTLDQRRALARRQLEARRAAARPDGSSVTASATR